MEKEDKAGAEQLEEKKLKLERLRLRLEMGFKQRELAFQQQQFEATHKGFGAWVATPLGAAIIAGLLGLFGTVWNGYQGNRIERQKLESSLILDAIKTSGTGEDKEKQTAANLKFLADAGLIWLSQDKYEVIKAKAGDRLPSLPNISSATPIEDAALQAKYYKEAEGRVIQSIVIHATESPATVESLDNLVKFFHEPDRPASTHYLVGVDGRVARILDESLVAFHIGITGDPKFNNQNSIGVDLIGFSKDGFAAKQVTALENLLADIARRNKIDVSNIVGHKEITGLSRPRIDPGPKLDLDKLRETIRARLQADNQPGAAAPTSQP